MKGIFKGRHAKNLELKKLKIIFYYARGIYQETPTLAEPKIFNKDVSIQ